MNGSGNALLSFVVLTTLAALATSVPAAAGVVGITVSSDTGSGTTELIYYDANAGLLGDTTNVSGIFTSIAAGDFDEDDVEEIVAARHIPNGCGPGISEGDLYYYEFQGSALFFDTSNLCSEFTSVATGNFDADAAAEVVAARYFGSGTVADPFETELRFYQPNTSGSYADSPNPLARFIAVATGNLDADPLDEVVVVETQVGGLATTVESQIRIGEGSGTLIADLSPNRLYELTDATIGSFQNGANPANVLVTNDRRSVALNSRAEGFLANTDTATIAHPFDSVPQRSEGMVGIAHGNFDGDGINDFAVITNLAAPAIGFVELYHGDGVSTNPTTVEFLAGPNPSQTVAVDTGDLDDDGRDEIVVLYDLQNGTSQIINYKVQPDFTLTVLSAGTPFNGTGTDVVVVESIDQPQVPMLSPAGLGIFVLGLLALLTFVSLAPRLRTT